MLTDAKIRSLKPSPHDRWISDGNKLYLRVRATGARSWTLRRRAEDGGNLTLGTWPELSLAEARVKAGSYNGKDIRGVTLREVLEEWFADVVAKRYRRPHEVSGYIERLDSSLKSTRVDLLQRVIVRQSLKRYAEQRGPRAAKRLLSILKTALQFACDAGYIDAHPLARLSGELVGGKDIARARVLSDAEIRAVWSTDKRLLRFLLLTGCRIGEAQSARWSDIHGDRLLIPAERSKSRKPQWIALSRQALQLLGELDHERELVFGIVTDTGAQSWLKRWCEREKIAPAFTPHDLRRTCATRMNELGVPPHVVEKILGHSMQGVMAVYNRAEYAPERIAAAQLWADEIDRILTSD